MSADLADVSARQSVQQALAAIDRPGGQGSVAFLTVARDRALAHAQVVDQLRASGAQLGPLAGAPVAIKDLFDVEGEQTNAGAAENIGAPAARDAAAVALLRASHLIPIGRTNMTEFAFSGLGVNSHHGTPLSPWKRDEERIAGGSTSGGAVAVADGMARVALGSDTGGSCRIPAAFCGIVGFKPTASRVSSEGVLPLSTSLDSVGWLTRSVQDAILVDEILADRPPTPNEVDLSGWRLGIPKQLMFDDLAPEVSEAFNQAIEHLKCAGAVVVPVEVPELEEIARINSLGGFPAAEAFAWHRARLETHSDSYDPLVIGRIRRGSGQSAADYIKLLEDRRSLIDRVTARLACIDFLVFPTVPILPPKLADLQSDDAYTKANLLVLRNSTAINMIDGCAISLPLKPLPVGLTLSGLRGQDISLLAVASAVEAALERE